MHTRESPWRDDRGPHLVTRGNVDGILSAAVVLAAHPSARVSFVPSSSMAVDVLRRDIGSDLVLADLGLTPNLVRTLNAKAKTRQRVLFIDHHQQSVSGADALGTHVVPVVREGASAASVTLDHLEVPELTHLGAIADVVEHCSSRHYEDTVGRFGVHRVQVEACHLDFAWRFKVEDDRFRLQAARALSMGQWPSEVPEVRRRFLVVHNEGRYERAQVRAKERLRLRGDVAILDFGRRKPSLLGFGSRAMTAAAQSKGASVAVLVNRRPKLSSIALRGFSEEVNLGRFVEEFTRHHGVAGGGHPASAGARIHTRDVPRFLDDLVALAANA